MDLKDQFRKLGETSVVLLTGSANYIENNISILDVMCNERGFSGVYINLNRPFVNMKSLLAEKKIDIDQLIFVDAITYGSNPNFKDKHCILVRTPQSLTDMSIAVDAALKNIRTKKKFLFMDSVSTLLIYNPVDNVKQFTHYLANKSHTLEMMAVFVMLESEATLLPHLSQFCDKVISSTEKTYIEPRANVIRR